MINPEILTLAGIYPDKPPGEWTIADLQSLLAEALQRVGPRIPLPPIPFVVNATWKRKEDGLLVTILELPPGRVRFVTPLRVTLTYEDWLFRAQYVWVSNAAGAT